MTPFPVAVGLCAPLAGRMADRHAPGSMIALGMLVFAAALATMAYLNRSISDLGVCLGMAVAGAGFGLFQTPNNRICCWPRRGLARGPLGEWSRWRG